MQKSSRDDIDRIAVASEGFTLLELLVVMSIVGILSTMAVVSYAHHIQGEQAKSLTQEFASAVLLARSAAIQSGTPTIFCGSSNAASCDGQWSKGWIVFRDDDRDSAKDANEDFILRRAGNSDHGTLVVKSSDDKTLKSTRFNYRGAPDKELSIEASSGEQTKTMTVTSFGKPRIHD